MKLINPAHVVRVERDNWPTYTRTQFHAESLGFKIHYSVSVPMTTRARVNAYRVFLTGGRLDSTPFIIVHGERTYLTPELAKEVMP